MKRYNLVLPEELYDQFLELAATRQTTVVDLLRRFIKLGLIAARLDTQPGAALILREISPDGRPVEREIVMI